MTMPKERTRALRFGWEFLIELQASDNINERQRSTIEEILRHYPTGEEIKQWAQDCALEKYGFAELAPEDPGVLSSADPSIPDNVKRGPTRPVDRTRALISAYTLFSIDLLGSDNLTTEQRRQIPYVLRHFPAVHDINAWARNDALESQKWLATEESSCNLPK